jgi:hypothetical protein
MTKVNLLGAGITGGYSDAWNVGVGSRRSVRDPELKDLKRIFLRDLRMTRNAPGLAG